MQVCKECGRRFMKPLKIEENHGLEGGPYEVFYVCPYCRC